NRHAVAPVNLPVADRTDVPAVRAIVPQPLGQLVGIAGPGAALPERGLDRLEGDGYRIAGLGAFDPDRPGERIAVGHRLAVAAIIAGAYLPAEGVLAFDDDRFAGHDAEPRLHVAAEFVVERALR